MSTSLKMRRLLTTALCLLVAVALSLSGCGGGDKAVETDPTGDLGADGGANDLEDVTLQDDPFADDGSQTDQGDVGSEDLDDADDAIAVELEDVYFDYDSFDFDATDRAALASNARALRDQPRARVVIEGHCDERGTLQYNLALGEKRARETKRYLVSLGVSASQIEIVSYGKERPFAVGDGDAVWSQNRRSHFVVQDGAGQ
jgi:peptidoglycan-associated lipoprotein